MMDKIIREYFKAHKLPKPGTINYVGAWAKGDVYAVTCGLIFLRQYAVYCIAEEIHSVRERGVKGW